MCPDTSLAAARQAIFETDLIRAKDHLTDISNWINNGGFIPDGFYRVLDKYNDLERELAKYV